ncbi:MAG: hypothetical protein GX442_15045 [Candidatus Riflebacteria bacterium]|nr:hypothetical protein [Candidatus Riflebacteria bacterium]
MNRRNLVLAGILVMTLAVGAPAGEFKDWVKKIAVAEHYQQDGLQLVDPKGDAHLIRMLDTVPMKLLNSLVKGSYPQAEIDKEREMEALEAAQKQAREAAGFKIGNTRPIDPDRLVNAIRQIIGRYPKIVPTLGEEHRWCPEAKPYLWYGFWHRFGRVIFRKQKEFPSPLFLRSKLFLLLACGWTSRYAVTGQEQELTRRLMLYPDRAVQIHDLFRESYLLNRGNLYLTMLTAENVLAGNPYREDRQNDPLQKKLAYLRHDTCEFGDNYGAWYHFFGIGLYGMLRAPVAARAVAEIEALGSLFLEAPDKQETYMNRIGAIFGRKLNRMMVNGDWHKPLTAADRTDYLLPNPALAAPQVGKAGQSAP